ncbi:uncharacterized, partial [Tachysurus ichikawai]
VLYGEFSMASSLWRVLYDKCSLRRVFSMASSLWRVLYGEFSMASSL